MTVSAERLDNTPTVLPLLAAELREQRWDLLDDMRPFSTSGRLRGCGRRRIASTVTVRLTGGQAGYLGLLKCGRVWICPVCSARIMMERALEIAAGVDYWQQQSRSIVFTTTTARHHAGHELAPLLDAVVKAWSSSTSGKLWVRDRESMDIAGFSRSLEVLHSARNGWHPHLHSLLFAGENVRQGDVQRFEERLYRRWDASLMRAGYSSLPIAQKVILLKPGTDPSTIGRYLAKSTEILTTGKALGFELTSAATKSRSVGRTQWQLAIDAAAGNKRDQQLWNVYEAATAGRRQLTWSHGLRDQLRLAVELSDQEITETEIGSAADNLVHITAEGWETVLSHPGLPVRLLSLLQQSRQQFFNALAIFQIEHTIATAPETTS